MGLKAAFAMNVRGEKFALGGAVNLRSMARCF